MEPTNASEQQASEQTSETAAEQTATDETTKASEPQPSDATPEPAADAKADAPQPEPETVLELVDTKREYSAAELVKITEDRLAAIDLRIDEERQAMTKLADAASRTTTTTQAVSQIAEHQRTIAELTEERGVMEQSLVPLRAAIATVEAELASAEEDARSSELTGELGELLSDALEAAQELEGAVNNLVAIVRDRKKIRSRFREVLSAVVRDPQQRGMINSQVEPLFSETPTLDQFLTVDAQLLAGSGVHAAERAQKVRDRIAEATA